MVKFKLSTIAGVWGKKLGKEEISVELSEWEMQSILRSMSKWNKSIFKKIKVELIEEALKEGYDFDIEIPSVKKRCPECKKVIEI